MRGRDESIPAGPAPVAVPAGGDPWLTLRGVSFEYGGTRVFDGLEATAADHEPVLAVVGASGVGKTTLIRLLAGYVRPGRGTISICGEEVRGPSASRPVVFQDHGLFPWKSVLANVTFGLKCAGVPRQERERRGHALIERMGLGGTADLLPAVLSGGMRQRVGLARALAVSPSCVLMDEPFSALDDTMKEDLCLEVSRLAARDGIRFVIVTHDLADAAFLGSRVLALGGPGRATELAAAEPPHPRTAALRHSPGLGDRVERLKEALATGGMG